MEFLSNTLPNFQLDACRTKVLTTSISGTIHHSHSCTLCSLLRFFNPLQLVQFEQLSPTSVSLRPRNEQPAYLMQSVQLMQLLHPSHPVHLVQLLHFEQSSQVWQFEHSMQSSVVHGCQCRKVCWGILEGCLGINRGGHTSTVLTVATTNAILAVCVI
jgi:hypothetical protein